MRRAPAGLPRCLLWAASTVLLSSACQDNSQSPAPRPEIPQKPPSEGDGLGPIDLVYVCGNKFLATNATGGPVQVDYRVVGTEETGSLNLVQGPEEDPAYGETELETTQPGTVELYRDGRRVANRHNEGSPCGASASPKSASVSALAGPETSGAWSAPFDWPVVAINASLLPNGRVLAWGLSGTPQVWNPSTGSFVAVPVGSWLFCSGQSFLSDGRLLVSGGHIKAFHGIPDINLFSFGTQTWTTSTPMQQGRWYPTNTTLASGDVLILAGTDENQVQDTVPEIWSPSGFRRLTAANRTLPYYPRTFLAPNGRVFYAGEERTTRYLNTTGTGSWSTVGDRLYGSREYGSAVMYDTGKVLYVGGGRTTNTAETIDLNVAAPAWKWTGSMAFARRHLTATVLPTGEVLVTGGVGGTAFNDLTQGAHAAELWSPSTGIWTTLAGSAVTRGYHSTSLLLPDGRVLHAGSGGASGAPDETNAELFSPPYLFKGTRPTISAVASPISYNSTFTVTTSQAASISKVSLIRLPSVTHAFDMNQRYQRLPFARGSGVLTVTAPTSRNVTPPGHYMLFILNSNGVPSKAKIVRVR
jgi:galactose oxidase